MICKKFINEENYLSTCLLLFNLEQILLKYFFCHPGLFVIPQYYLKILNFDERTTKSSLDFSFANKPSFQFMKTSGILS